MGEREFVFNVVWAGTVFSYLRFFVQSQIAHTEAHFRFVANACPPAELALLEAFAASEPQVVEVLEVSRDEMVPHGTALERVRDARDDGEFFCLIDSDIRASGPFVADFAAILAGETDNERKIAGVTSGKGVWSTSDVVPEGHPGVNGEYFYSRDGFLFGSPHFAMYRRAAIDDVRDRWGVRFDSAGPDLAESAAAALAAAGHDYWLYDTGKLVNVFLQESGHELRHQEHPNLLHIGGMTHYLSPPELSAAGPVAKLGRVDRTTWNADRLEVAEFSAAVLRGAVDGGTVPTIPEGLTSEVAEKLTMVRREILAIVP
ncbi:MAG: hypothetical protein RIB98_10905 [Acidimicrobiales bacterium]